MDSRVVRSSGASALDEEALALLRRAQPFPPPPRDWRPSASISPCRFGSI
jgi:TonB family protein